jgi:small-conductance mechanosensitive channel
MIPTTFAAVSEERLARVCGEDPGFFCRNVLEWTGDRTLAELADFMIGKPLMIAAIVIGAVIASRLARRGMKGLLRTLQSGAVQERIGTLRAATPDALLETREHSLRSEQRMEALASVLRSLASVVIYAIAAFMVLAEVGIELGPLLAGAGIVGVALGFGSQSLVRDFLSGVFILIEDQFGVGDIVNLDDQTSGVVEAVSLRTTRLRSVDGTMWHVPNGEIRRVGNQSQHWSRALIDVEVAYETDIDKAEAVIASVAEALAAEDRDILETPEVWGVEALGANGVIIRLVVKTRPSEQYRISRELRRRIKATFEREGIEIPFPQQTVWHRDARHADDASGSRDLSASS